MRRRLAHLLFRSMLLFWSVFISERSALAGEQSGHIKVQTILRSPITNVQITTFTGSPDMVSLSSILTRFRPLKAEAGVNFFTFAPIGSAKGCYARAGFAKQLEDQRNPSGRRLTQHLSLMGGYRIMIIDNDFHPLPNQAITLNQGLNVVQWISPNMGISTELSGGMDHWFIADYTLEPRRFTPDLRIAFGLAF